MEIFDYPVTHQYELTYKLKIEVPEGHSIDLMFSKSQELNDTSSCESCKPYIEILQYFSSGEPYSKINRIDDLSKSANVSIPHHKVDIRFFSGLNWNQSQSLRNNKYSMSFKVWNLVKTPLCCHSALDELIFEDCKPVECKLGASPHG
ncbi:uncharacterized protein TNCV_4326011 [Trichonephila clavipes]|nr:uncharacterized protein TNCV_4326011 [Trichonephila clavipes]